MTGAHRRYLAGRSATPAPHPTLVKVDHVCLAVADIDASIGFYQDVLGLEHRYADEETFGKDPAFLQYPDHDTCVALIPLANPLARRRHHGAHCAFSVSRDSFEWYRERLPGLVRAAKEVHGGSRDVLPTRVVDEQDYALQLSLFFSDLDNNMLEITTWVGKDDPRPAGYPVECSDLWDE